MFQLYYCFLPTFHLSSGIAKKTVGTPMIKSNGQTRVIPSRSENTLTDTIDLDNRTVRTPQASPIVVFKSFWPQPVQNKKAMQLYLPRALRVPIPHVSSGSKSSSRSGGSYVRLQNHPKQRNRTRIITTVQQQIQQRTNFFDRLIINHPILSGNNQQNNGNNDCQWKNAVRKPGLNKHETTHCTSC